ncbi:unnamed protein product [Calypogeia fissa]
MRVKKDRWNFAWNSLTKLALSVTVIPLLWPDSLGPQSFRSSQFVEWEVWKPRHQKEPSVRTGAGRFLETPAQGFSLMSRSDLPFAI